MPARSPAHGFPVAAILLLLGALTLLPMMDGCAKLLSQTLSVYEITWARYLQSWQFIRGSPSTTSPTRSAKQSITSG